MKRKYIILLVLILGFILYTTNLYSKNRVWYKFQQDIKNICSQVKKIDACTIGPTSVIDIYLKNSNITINECENLFKYAVTQLKTNEELYAYVPKQKNTQGIPKIVHGVISFVDSKNGTIKYRFRTISSYSLNDWVLDDNTNQEIYYTFED